ncbi:uncharacterized protein [Manis javanica]|uniref:uncharacterized protein n=1 Tax=Manis javanica TaxID=9974 RepID=UPI003C6CD0F5
MFVVARRSALKRGIPCRSINRRTRAKYRAETQEREGETRSRTEARVWVRGADPARRLGPPPGTAAESGKRPTARTGPCPPPGVRPHPVPGPAPTSTVLRLTPSADTPGTARGSAPPVRPPAPRRPPLPHLLTSSGPGSEQLCLAPTSHPPPALRRRARPVRSAAERAEGESPRGGEEAAGRKRRGGGGLRELVGSAPVQSLGAACALLRAEAQALSPAVTRTRPCRA